ncbi:MAG: dethiobiotin synthase [Magnetococcales bacterium]|nr:dethiobiotin synthase [Magnetococcales bacterium]
MTTEQTAPAGFFVTGTDTGVGKSVASTWLLHHFGGQYWKPVQAGAGSGEETDTAFVHRLSGLSEERFYPSAYTLALPRSPHEAARKEGVVIRLERLQLPVARRPWVVEGAGGILVPLNGTDLMLDLMTQLGLPVILVARTTLGTINHTLLSLACLRQRGLTIAGVILNGVPDAENRQAISHYGQVTILADIPLLQPLDREALLRVPGNA